MQCVSSGALRSPKLLIVVQIGSFWPVWQWYIARLLDSSDEPWGILALATALAFVLIKGKEAPGQQRTLLAAAGLTVLYCLSYSFVPPLVRGLVAVASLALSTSTLCLGRTVHLGILGLLLLSLPIIASLQFYLGYPVRLLTALASAEIISLTGYPAEAQGTGLFWAGEMVTVDAPCSGIKMLWSALYLNFTLACFGGLSTLRTWLAYLFSLAAVFIGNVLRASILFFTESEIVAAPDWAHQSIGLAVFGGVALAVLSFHGRMREVSYAG